LNSVLF